MALDALAREGARRMILAALEVEVEEYRRQYRDARDSHGHALVVRNRAGPAAPPHGGRRDDHDSSASGE